MSYFDAALEIHKERFDPFRALIILDDKALRSYVISWVPQLVRRLDDYPLDNDMPTLWKCVDVDYQALADLTGDPMPLVMAYFRRAQGLQLIYPDGTLARAVTDLLLSKFLEAKKS